LQALEDHNWNFARKRVTLATHSEDPPENQWTYRYEYPSDCVKARLIANPLGWSDDAVPFEVETTADGAEKTILTDMAEAVLVYTFDQTNPVMFSSRFIDALSWRIAYHLAFPLTGKQEIETKAMQVYNAIIRQATGSNAGEGHERGPREAESIRARA
jgi:hypothetical protein